MNDYKINEQGIIVSPGKFEGCQGFAPNLWRSGLEGFSNDEFSGGYGFIFRSFEDVNGKGVACILTEDENGFIWDRYYDTVEEYKAAIQTEKECDDIDNAE